ncbi:chitin-binding domain protein cbd-1 [Drosophila willistoni]|nr:chitin-binding domain protein cbd-1 [Drosophila willistoni]
MLPVLIWISLLTAAKMEIFEIDEDFCISLPTGYYEYPYECDAYISCNDSHAELEYCPDEKLFNSQLDICDTPEAVECYPILPDICRNLTNSTLLPAGSECNEYIECVNGISVLHECPGNLWYNPEWRICDDPNDTWCDNTTTTTTTTTTMTTTTPTTRTTAAETITTELDTTTIDDLFEGCLNEKQGTSLPYVENCQEYYYCWGNGSYSLFPCPADNWFSPYTGNCGPEVSPELCREITTTISVTAANNPCESQELGTSFALTSNCNEYLLCLGNGQSTIAKCPSNAWFDPQGGNCGPNVSPLACRESTTTVASTTETTTVQPENICAGKEEGASFPLTSDCQKYILCMGNGESVIVRCIANAWFDPQTSNCGPNVSPTACQEVEVSSTTESTTQSTTESTTELSTETTDETTATTDYPIDLEICSGQTTGEYVSYPDNCEKYIVCADPVPIAFYCTPGYYFSESLQKCVSWLDSDCPDTGSETTTSWPLPSPTPTVCANSSGLTLPYPEDCQWYIRCVDDYVYMMEVCQKGEFYDPWRSECGADVSPDACLDTYETTSSPDETSSTIGSTTSTTASPQLDPCEGIQDGKLVPYPDDCTRFIICVKPNPIIGNCVVGQEFSAQLERCMAPWYANCSIIITTTTEEPSTTTTRTTTEITPSQPDDFCADQADKALVPYPYNCSKYIICQEPIPVGYECPQGEEFSPIELTCMDAELANCNDESNKDSQTLAKYLLQTIGNWIQN